MEDLIQVLFFLVVVLASMFDAAARKRKRRRSEAESEEEWSGDETSTLPDWGTPEEETGEAAGSRGTASTRDTADSMIPEDLWAILTGQPLPRPQTEEPPAAERAPAGFEAGDPDARETSWQPWEAGESTEPVSAERPWEEPASAERPWEDVVRAPDRGERPLVVRPREVQARDTETAPRRVLAAVAAEPVPPPAPRRGPTGPLWARDRGSLRRAVIMTEVLGRPLALRDRWEPWEAR